MKIAVVDTSALIRLYVPDGPVPNGFNEFVTLAWRGEATLLIPELGLVEFAQVLWKKEQAKYLTRSEANEIMEAVTELPLEVIGHANLIIDALNLARSYDLTVYDAVFLSLSKLKHAIFFTSDERLEKVYKRLSKNQIR